MGDLLDIQRSGSALFAQETPDSIILQKTVSPQKEGSYEILYNTWRCVDWWENFSKGGYFCTYQGSFLSYKAFFGKPYSSKSDICQPRKH